MSWSLSMNGHFSGEKAEANEQQVLAEIKEFIVDLLEGFDDSNAVTFGLFSGQYHGSVSLDPNELLKSSPRYKHTAEELQEYVDELSVERNAENYQPELFSMDRKVDVDTGGTEDA